MKILYKVLHSKNRGFTLVEMLVAVSIFSVVMIIAVGSLVSIIDANRKARTHKTVLNNLNATLETMSRNIREGSNYTIVSSSHFSFTDSSNRKIQYRLIDELINRQIDSGAPIPITAPEVTIRDLQFQWIVNSDQPDPVRKLLITVDGIAGSGDERTASEFNIQSLVSQRFRPAFGGGPAINPVDPNIVCPFTSGPARELRNFFEIKTSDTVLSGGGVSSSGTPRPTRRSFVLDGSETFNQPIPAGTYQQVGIAGFDRHCDIALHPTEPPPYCEPVTQDYEYMYVELYDATVGGNLLLTTDPTADIPDTVNVNLPPEFVDTDQGTSVTLPADVRRIEVVHGLQHSSNATLLASLIATDPTQVVHSLVPACIVLDGVSATASTSVEINPF